MHAGSDPRHRPVPRIEHTGAFVSDHCLAPGEWRTSTSSNYGSCVEVRFVADSVHVRNSRDPEGPILVFTMPEWEAFLAGVTAREFDTP